MKNKKNNHARKSRKNELGHQGEERRGNKVHFFSCFKQRTKNTKEPIHHNNRTGTHVEYVLTDHKQSFPAVTRARVREKVKQILLIIIFL